MAPVDASIVGPRPRRAARGARLQVSCPGAPPRHRESAQMCLHLAVLAVRRPPRFVCANPINDVRSRELDVRCGIAAAVQLPMQEQS